MLYSKPNGYDEIENVETAKIEKVRNPSTTCFRWLTQEDQAVVISPGSFMNAAETVLTADYRRKEVDSQLRVESYIKLNPK